jgi:hypothetical protein
VRQTVVVEPRERREIELDRDEHGQPKASFQEVY